MSEDEVEAVASAFYEIEYSSSSWDHAPELLKDAFRMDARLAIASCQEGYLGAEPFEAYWHQAGIEEHAYLH